MCVGVNCPVPGECEQPGSCDAATGLCEGLPPQLDGTPCSGGSCQGGVCTGEAVQGFGYVWVINNFRPGGFLEANLFEFKPRCFIPHPPRSGSGRTPGAIGEWGSLQATGNICGGSTKHPSLFVSSLSDTGTCAGVTCGPPGECEAAPGACNPATGACGAGPPVADGTPCGAGSCQAGACTGAWGRGFRSAGLAALGARRGSRSAAFSSPVLGIRVWI
jgi:hypothetical protein